MTANAENKDGSLIDCPVCSVSVPLSAINRHLDANCEDAGLEDREMSIEAEPVNDAVNSFFTPTQSRKSQSIKKEVQETPTIASQRPSQKRKVAEYDSDDGVIKIHNSKGEKTHMKSALRGKEALQQVAPLADRLRPKTLDDFIGQEDLVGPAGILRGLIDANRIPSLIFWGPSGTGKTTLARIISKSTTDEYLFKELSATNNNVADCKKVFEDASNHLTLTGKRTLLFLDEIHRFTKSQQDVFLPYVESGKITLIGATTENPSFRINNALVSRCRIFVLSKLSTLDIHKILSRALDNLGDAVPDDIVGYLSDISDGDARVALNLLDLTKSMARPLSLDSLKKTLSRTTLSYDKSSDLHYDTISAFHKSIRGSDVDATLYYLARMLESGEDPLYIARRMVRIASEDVGLADHTALGMSSSVYTAVQQVGMPECDCILAQCAVYLARCEKSVSVYRAYQAAKKTIREVHGAASAEIPMQLRNAPTRLMKDMGYGEGYVYNPDHVGEEEEQRQEYLPVSLRGTIFFNADEEIHGQTLLSELDEGERML